MAADAVASAAELAAALAADASLAAGAEAVSEAAGAGAVAVVSAGAVASAFLPQALKMTAAAIALRTSLVFIYRYPKMSFSD